MPVNRVAFSTTRSDEARALLDEIYGSTHLRVHGRGNLGHVSFSGADAGDFTVGSFSATSTALSFAVEGEGTVTLAFPTSGQVRIDRGKATSTYGPGDVFIGICPHGRQDARADHASTVSVSLDGSLLLDGSSKRTASQRWTREPVRGLEPGWRATVSFVGALLADPVASSAPLVVAAAGRLLATTALAMFPADELAGASMRDGHDAHPATLRRAIAFIDANPARNIGIIDIARAANVTPRAVQLAFRRHLAMTPLQYLRIVRLRCAHQDLHDATPGDGQTVTSVAYRWGFSSPSRFARYYRAAHGERPSTTLQRR